MKAHDILILSFSSAERAFVTRLKNKHKTTTIAFCFILASLYLLEMACCAQVGIKAPDKTLRLYQERAMHNLRGFSIESLPYY